MRNLAIIAFLCASLTAPGQWSYAWAVENASTTSNGEATTCAAGPDGGAVMAGYFSLNLVIDTFSVSVPWGAHWFIAAVDSAGHSRWGHVFDTRFGGEEHISEVAIDGSGNTYAGGRCIDTLLMDGSILIPDPDTLALGPSMNFVIKFDTAGAVVWVATFPSTGNYSLVNGITVDQAGDVFGAGLLSGFSTLFKLNGDDGSVIFSITGTGGTFTAVGTDTSGNAYLGGETYQSFSFGGLTCLANNVLGGNAITEFVCKVDTSGNALWFHVPDQGLLNNINSGSDTRKLAVTDDGRSYMLATHPTVIGTDTIGIGNGRPGLYCLDPNGAPIWGRDLVAAGQLVVRDLATSQSDDVALIGYCTPGSTSLLEGPLYSAAQAGSMFFLAQYDASGSLNGLLQGPSDLQPTLYGSRGNGVAFRPDGTPLLCGAFSAPQVVFGPSVLTTIDLDLFLASTHVGPLVLGTGSGLAGPMLTLAPVPASNELWVTFPDGRRGVLDVFDATGRLFAHVQVDQGSSRLDVSAWPAGVFVARHATSGASARFVVAR